MDLFSPSSFCCVLNEIKYGKNTSPILDFEKVWQSYLVVTCAGRPVEARDVARVLRGDTGNPLYSGTRNIPARIVNYRVYFA